MRTRTLFRRGLPTAVLIATFVVLAFGSIANAERYAPGPGAPDSVIDRCAGCHGYPGDTPGYPVPPIR